MYTHPSTTYACPCVPCPTLQPGLPCACHDLHHKGDTSYVVQHVPNETTCMSPSTHIPACMHIPKCLVSCCDMVTSVPQPSCHEICQDGDASLAIQHMPNKTTCTSPMRPPACPQVCTSQHVQTPLYAMSHAATQSPLHCTPCVTRYITTVMHSLPSNTHPMRPPTCSQLLHQ